ncbi:MAG: cold shock domain-containing protein [Dorea sp.]|jgi:cold shock CspA family protein|nr:cold shock domain-containing protein [Dorea sp.]
MSKVMDEYLSQDREWGVVTMYNKDRGFGFIKSKVDGKSYFTHVSQVYGGYLERGYLVEFNIGINKRTGKEQAENVIVIETPLYRKRYCKTSKISYKSKFKKF